MSKRLRQRLLEPGMSRVSLSPVNSSPTRTQELFDAWSVLHFSFGILFGWIMAPFLALALLVAWEPLEIFVLSPFFARFGIAFGYESLRNSLSDIFFDMMGIFFGALILGALFLPPFHIL